MRPVPDHLVAECFDELLSDVALEVVFDLHRKLCSGKLCVACDSPLTDLCGSAGVDVFGQPLSQAAAPESFACNNCGQRVSSVRFAPHLEKCMGKGGRTLRGARSAATAKSASLIESAGGGDDHAGDNDDDDDYKDAGNGGDDFYDPADVPQHSDNGPAASKRRRRENATAELFMQAVTEHRKRSPQELATFFDQYCGAVSHKNGKLCANLLGRCSVHSDSDRRVARDKVLSVEDPFLSSPESADPYETHYQPSQLSQMAQQYQPQPQPQQQVPQTGYPSPRPAPPPPAFFPSFTATTTNVVLPKAILDSPHMQALRQQQTPPRGH